MDQLTQILKDLRQGGARLTPIRRRLLGIFQQSQTPLAISELLKKLKASRPAINKTTVYREIEFLQDKGLVREAEFGDGRKRYESALSRHHHHFVCGSCQRVQDVIVPESFKKLEKKLAAEKRVKILNHNLEFFGLCAACR